MASLHGRVVLLITPSFLMLGWLSPLSATQCIGVCDAGHVPKAGGILRSHPSGSSWLVFSPPPVLQSSNVCPHPARFLPHAGGMLCVTYAVAVGTGISYFQYADIDSGRNIFIVGFTMFMALLVPRWLNVSPARLITGSGDVPWAWQNLSPVAWQLPVPAVMGG